MTRRSSTDLDTQLAAAFPLGEQRFSEKIILRPLLIDDLNDLVVILGDDPLMTWTRRRWTIENVSYLLDLRLSHYKRHGFGVYAVIDSRADAIVGMAGLQHWDDNPEGDIEALAYVDRSRWNEGLATSILAWCGDRAFRECPLLSRIVAATRHDNKAAQAVARGLGMAETGEGEHWGAPAITWALTRDEWTSRQARS